MNAKKAFDVLEWHLPIKCVFNNVKMLTDMEIYPLVNILADQFQIFQYAKKTNQTFLIPN